ncbi:hypothetical protein [Mycolicibacter acidiphilus]|uniref:hypothetical protein n=1 Tax=Mycolicibacter acidiphilus TaxID=2835306 RepID=UPI002022DC8F|nr:hypothetical protein [Mycolicibacter acidiphilus]
MVVLVLAAAVAAGVVWVTHDSTTPLEKDCATVRDLGGQLHELGVWMTARFDDNTDDDLSDVVERQSALDGRLRAAAEAVSTPELRKPLRVWADALALDAKLQREANESTASDPQPQWVREAQEANLLSDDAIAALDQQCPGLKRTVLGH